MRISDVIQYLLVLYAFFCIREYYDYVRSRSFLIVKILILYYILQFTISAFRYQFNALEYAFRLKGLWSSFLIFPYLLLLKRGGLTFFIKLIFPVAIISNILYILTALTGIAFLPDLNIIRQPLPGDIVVYRVFGGTFFGEFFFLGFIYYWITKRFRVYQLFAALLFVFPHILAFGRGAWVYFAFTILLMLVLNSLRKREFKILLRQTVILCVLALSILYVFIKILPNSDFYFDAISARIWEAQDDVEHKEGTYGTRVVQQNATLVKLWLENNLLIGIGMHPLWVHKPETFNEQLAYNAFSDVSWPSVLAAYGAIGFALSFFVQMFFMFYSLFMIRKLIDGEGLLTFFLTLLFAKFFFDTFINFSYGILTIGLWGFFGIYAFYTAIFVYSYKKYISDKKESIVHTPILKRLILNSSIFKGRSSNNKYIMNTNKTK